MSGTVDLADLEHWLITESQYIRVRSLATNSSIGETFRIVGDVLEREAFDRFPGVDVIKLLREEVERSIDLRSISFSDVQKMRELIDMIRGGPIGDPPPQPPSPPRPGAPAGAMGPFEDAAVTYAKASA